MSHYEEKYDDFVVDSTILRRRFQPDGGSDRSKSAQAALSLSALTSENEAADWRISDYSKQPLW
jgi:hypothetical protein